MACKTPEDERARDAALWYKETLGFNCLPSRTDKKAPALKQYAELRDEGFPDELYERWWTPNIQIATGCKWNLLVLDLDGPESLITWECLAALRTPVRTWAIRHDEAGGMHLWFACPPQVVAVPFDTTLWCLEGQHHAKIQLLGDRNLIVAPPSINIKTGKPYAFVEGLSPTEIERPADLPMWIFEMARDTVVPRVALANLPPKISKELLDKGGRFSRSEVLAAIPDKVHLARAWRLRFGVDRPNQSGWMGCHAIDREDRRPSASFHVEQGLYWESGKPVLSFFDMAVALGAYSSWQDCCDDLGRTYLLGAKK